MKKNQKKAKQLFFESFKEIIFLIIVFLLPTQFGKHFFFNFSYLNGLRVDYLAPTIYLIDIFIFILFLFHIKEVFRFLTKKSFLFIYFFLLINIIFSKNKFIASYGMVRIFQWLIFYYLSKIYFKKISKKILLINFLIIGLVQLFLSFYQMIFHQSVQGIFYFLGERLFNIQTPGIAKSSFFDKEILRPYGSFSHPNSLGGFFLLLYFFVLTEKDFKKNIFLKSTVLLIFNILIFFSFSKVAIITFLILNSFYFIFSFKKTNCFFCFLNKIINPLFLGLIFLFAKGDLLTFEKRVELIKNSFSIIYKNFFFGVGIKNYLLAQTNFSSKFPFFFNQPVHNIFLLLLAETGIFIFSFFIFYLLNIFKNIFQEKKLFLLYLFLPVILTGFFDHYWLTLSQNFLVLAFVYGSVSSSFFIFKFSSKS